MKRLPRSFRRGHDDSLACRHRDLSCCPACAASHPEIVEVAGAHFWIADENARAELLAVVAVESDLEDLDKHCPTCTCNVQPSRPRP